MANRNKFSCRKARHETSSFCVCVSGYSVLYNPWLCLVFEEIEGVRSALSWRAAVVFAAKLSTKNFYTSVQGLLGGIYFGAGKPGWFWLFVKTIIEYYTVMKHRGEPSLFYVITKTKGSIRILVQKRLGNSFRYGFKRRLKLMRALGVDLNNLNWTNVGKRPLHHALK
jgi:hypothetical protein